MKNNHNYTIWKDRAERIVDILMSQDDLPKEEYNILDWLTNDEHAQAKAEIFADQFARKIKRGENMEDACRLWPALAARLNIAGAPKINLYRSARRKILYRIAATLFPLMIVSSLLWNRLDSPHRQSSYTPSMVVIENTVDSTASIQGTTHEAFTDHLLPDRSTVRLADGSTLRYKEDFESERHVELEGEAYFDVMKADDPFEVHFDDIKISVLGTMFRVNSRSGEIDLYHGSVNVETVERKILMKPGERLRKNQLTGTLEIYNLPLSERVYNGMPGLVFEGTSLPSIFEMLGRDYGVRFRVENGAGLQQQEIYGDFTGFSTIEEFMTMLTRISGNISYEITNNEVIIKGL